MITEPPRRSKRLLVAVGGEGEAPSATLSRYDCLFFTFVIIRRSQAASGLVGEAAGSIEFFLLVDACEQLTDWRAGE